MFGLPTPLAALLMAVISGAAATGMTRRAFRECAEPLGNWGRWSFVMASVLAGALVFAMQVAHAQQTPDVRPSAFWADGRVLFHTALMVLLVAATCIDLHCCLIPDSITVTGMVLGVLLACVSGDLQMCHVWVDWNAEIPQISGPYLPAWLSTHPHLHGLVWSLTGLLVGGVLTWTVRGIASAILGMEALGFGDVMLMAMIGSFLGWQPVLVVFLLAPLLALAVGILARMLGNRSYLPYGPFLALGAVIVVFTWRWIWMSEIPLQSVASAQDRASVFALRRLFGDVISLAVIAVATTVGLVVLLGLRQLYQSIPVRGRSDQEPPRDALTAGRAPVEPGDGNAGDGPGTPDSRGTGT